MSSFTWIRLSGRLFGTTACSTISAAEMYQALINLGQQVTQEEVDEMIQEADTDGDGEIDFEGLSLSQSFPGSDPQI